MQRMNPFGNIPFTQITENLSISSPGAIPTNTETCSFVHFQELVISDINPRFIPATSLLFLNNSSYS